MVGLLSTASLSEAFREAYFSKSFYLLSNTEVDLKLRITEENTLYSCSVQLYVTNRAASLMEVIK